MLIKGDSHLEEYTLVPRRLTLLLHGHLKPCYAGLNYLFLCSQVFVIKQGKLAVTIHKTTSVLETGDVFFVPQGKLCDPVVPSLYRALQNFIRSALLSFENFVSYFVSFVSLLYFR